MPQAATESGAGALWDMIRSGGFIMWPLIICSFASWVVIFERWWAYRKLTGHLRGFQLEAINGLLRDDFEGVKNLCKKEDTLPTARILLEGLLRLESKDVRLRERWWNAMERRRQLEGQSLRRYLWILGTIGSASPFIGLLGTVVGILRSFQEMAKSGSGGFAVVAAGISEALIATAVGIVVAVIAVMAFNAFQTRVQGLLLEVKLQIEELGEVVQAHLKPTTKADS